LSTRAVIISLALALALGACGPGSRGGSGADAGPDAQTSDFAFLTGTVWAPGNARGQAPDMQEIAIAGALVSAAQVAPPAPPDGVYCDACQEITGFGTRTDARGAFELAMPAGTYVLTIQKGQFRLDQTITVAARERRALGAAETTLPSTHDPAAGRWTPRIALATSAYDSIEDVLGKLGLGTLDAQGVLATKGDHIDYVAGPGGRTDITTGTLEGLMLDLEAMKRYHVIFIPCGESNPASALFSNPVVRENVRAYVAAGGKLYVTDWSAEWADVPFPGFIRFESAHDTTSPTCTGMCPAGTSGPDCCADGDDGSGSGEGYASHHTRTADDTLTAWLDGQYGPVYTAAEAIGRGEVDEEDFIVLGSHNRIVELPTVELGTDDMGQLVTETAHVWVEGGYGPTAPPEHPLTVTFEPNGCGRVMYSTYHTAETAHLGLLPQERVLLYLIMEIGECKDGPIVD
jgi:hypothetical protein